MAPHIEVYAFLKSIMLYVICYLMASSSYIWHFSSLLIFFLFIFLKNESNALICLCIRNAISICSSYLFLSTSSTRSSFNIHFLFNNIVEVFRIAALIFFLSSTSFCFNKNCANKIFLLIPPASINSLSATTVTVFFAFFYSSESDINSKCYNSSEWWQQRREHW